MQLTVDAIAEEKVPAEITPVSGSSYFCYAVAEIPSDAADADAMEITAACGLSFFSSSVVDAAELHSADAANLLERYDISSSLKWEQPEILAAPTSFIPILAFCSASFAQSRSI